jgi:molybdopterin-binding protein
MPTLRMSEAAELLGVSADTVRRLADARLLRAVRTRGGQRQVDGLSVAKYLAERDPASGRARKDERSIRNRFPGIVLRILKDRVAAQVEVQVGPHRMVSLVTREAVDALGLEPGMPVVASVKATNLSVDLPRGRPGRRHAD